jgi:hypothetical protein
MDHENVSLRALSAVLFTVALFAACQSPPDADDQPPAPLAAYSDACAGQPDYSRPPGCDRRWSCQAERCMGGVCELYYIDGGSCRTGGGSCSIGVCQEGACVSQCAGCGTLCEAQHLECIASCANEGCLCTCENSRRTCLRACRLPAPLPQDCPIG